MPHPSTPPPEEARNARLLVWSNGLQNIGDQLVAAKTVLPWLFQSLGVPGFFAGMLVPIRESGSMLPQAALTPWVTSRASRKRLWLIGSWGQAASAAAIAGFALTLNGWALGLATILALAGLSLFRALCSIAGKDIQGRTISQGTRGVVTGRAAQLGGCATLVVGLALYFLGTLPRTGLAGLLAVGAASWAVAALIFAAIHEPVPDDPPTPINAAWWTDTWQLFTTDAPFRRFVIVRALLLVTALSTSFIVVLAQQSGTDALSGLAGFVLASGLAGLVGGRISGRWSDASSRTVMATAAAFASGIIILLVLAAATLPAAANAWVMPIGFFLITLAHTSIRVARKTYVVDMAEGDQRTRYVGAANTLMGVILLGAGGLSALIALLGPSWALLFLAAIGLLGVLRARGLAEVSA